MCTCNSMMSYTVSLDDNENKVNRPADWYFSISNPNEISYH
jgi:spore coat protein U-like protein